MLQYFNENSLSLNFPKSSYLIINGNSDIHVKADLKLDFGILEYKPSVVYLGAVISDNGNISSDIEEYIDGKRANVTIKYNNFVRKNVMAPLPIKLKVLDVCVTSSLLYGCEIWGTSKIPSVEVIYRLGLKRALSVRDTTNTEIVYIEADRYPLSIRISKQQLKFLKSLTTYLQENPQHPLCRLIDTGRRIHLNYISYYENLEREYDDPFKCQQLLKQNFCNDWNNKFRREADNDIDSRLGTYLQVNPRLEAPKHTNNILECERIKLTRYRSGSHNLQIETGRWSNPRVDRDERFCSCMTGTQSIRHCLFDCPLLNELYAEYPLISVEEAFKMNNIVKFFIKMEKILNIKM